MLAVRVCSTRHDVDPYTYTISITLRVVTLPSTSFDGTTSVTFVAGSIGMNSSSVTRTPFAGSESGYDSVDESSIDETNSVYDPTSTSAKQAQLTYGTSSGSRDWSASVQDTASESGSAITSSTSFTVTFYHCDAGQVWNPSASAAVSSTDEDSSGGCQLCSDVVEGDTDVRACATVQERRRPFDPRRVSMCWTSLLQ